MLIRASRPSGKGRPPGESRTAERCASNLRNGQPRVIRLATTETVILTLLPAVLRIFKRLWPQGRLHPIDISSSKIAEALRNGEADIAIGVLLPSDENFECKPLLSSRRHGYFEGTQSSLVDSEEIEWADMAARPLIFSSRTTRLQIEAALPRSLTLKDVHEASTLSAALAMAASGQGILISPDYVMPIARLHHLCSRPLRCPEVNHELEISISRRHPEHSAVAEARDMLVAEFSNASRLARLPDAASSPGRPSRIKTE